MSSNLSVINRVAGLASGIDTNKIVADLMKVARIPLDQMLQKKQTLQWQQEDYRAINTSLINFRANQALKMKLQGTFQVKTATSSDATVVTATPGSGASTGTYSIKVTQLAEVASDISTAALSAVGKKIDPTATLESQKTAGNFATPWGATTTLQFSITTHPNGGAAVTETFTVDTTTDSLNDVIADINAKTGTLGVTAFYESSTDKIVIATTKTGDYSTNEIEVADVTDNFSLGTLALSSTAQGKNAIVDINGLTGITEYENTFTLNNITFNLLKTSGTPVTITVTNDVDAVVNTIKSFIQDFNSLLKTINDELNEKRYLDYPPLTDAQKEEMTDKEIEQWEEKAKSGLLNNDTILQNAVFELRRALTTQVTGLTTAYDSIFDIGITTGYYYEGGTLYVDETKLREAIQKDPEAVMKLFTTDDTTYTYEQKGLAVRLYDKINYVVDRLTDEAGYPSSFSLYDDSYIAVSIRELDERISYTEDRLNTLEERYWQQFTAMEQAIALFNTQSAWLTQQTNGG